MDINKKHDHLNNYIEQVEEINARFRKVYTEDMEKVTLRDLVPCLTEDDIKPYTEEGEADYVIQADPKLNPKAGQARMFTLDQLQHLFNVQFKRTHLMKRMSVNEAATRVLEEKVAALESWRPDIEERIAKRTKMVDVLIAEEDLRLKKFKKTVEEEFKNIEEH